MARYLRIWVLATLLSVLGVIGFNGLVDPWGIWHDIRIEGFNAIKPAQLTQQRLSEIGNWARHPVPNLILGTSRADIGLDPAHPGFSGAAYNFGMSGQMVTEAAQLMDWAAQRESLKQVVLATDFFSANALRSLPPDSVALHFSELEMVRKAAVFDTLVQSLKTVAFQHSLDQENDHWNDHGVRLWSDAKNVSEGGHRVRFKNSEEGYARQTYLPPPAYRYAFAGNGRDTETDYRSIFSIAHKKGIELHVLISPSHARQWEVVRALGLWPVWEDWKRLLVRINEEEAQRVGRMPFSLWDFSGYHDLTTEPVPALGDVETQMRWYHESSHYNRHWAILCWIDCLTTTSRGEVPLRISGCA